MGIISRFPRGKVGNFVANEHVWHRLIFSLGGLCWAPRERASRLSILVSRVNTELARAGSEPSGSLAMAPYRLRAPQPWPAGQPYKEFHSGPVSLPFSFIDGIEL